MSAQHSGVFPKIEQIRHQAALEKTRAARAAAIAERHEQRADHGAPAVQAHHHRIAALHRRQQRRHLAAARMQTAYADRLRRWHDDADPLSRRPLFLSAVASTLGATGVAVTLLDSRHTEALRAASNDTARAALDLEYTLSEGPGQDATTQRRLVAATSEELPTRWPRYGPAVAQLGIHAVAATPLHYGSHQFGALTAFDAAATHPTATLDELAQILVLPEYNMGLPLLVESDVQPVIHQAAGMIAVQRECDVDDALVLIRAHAFATNDPTEHVAARIVNRQLRLD